jgi:alpha-1,6-mannosyltransferase
VRIPPARKVYLLGVALCVALIACSRTFSDRGGPYFMASLVIAGVAYLFAVREFLATSKFSRNVVVFGLVLSAIWHVALLRVPSGLDDDIHRYVWDGRLQRLGYSPYTVVPSDSSVQALHTAETRNLNNPDLPTPYPPGAELFFRAVTAIHESTSALKIAFVVCDFLIAIVILAILRRTSQAAHLMLIYAWNPLLAVEVAGSGHIDIVGALLLVVSAAALIRRWRALAAVAFGLAVAAKFLPIVLLPLYWKRIRVRDAVLAVFVVALLYVPFLGHGHIATGSLGTYVQSFRFNGPVVAMLHDFMPPKFLAAVAVLVGLYVAYRRRKSQQELSSDDFAWPMAACLFFAPVVFPWYLLWLMPFMRSRSTMLIALWTVSIIPTYVMWHLRALGRPWGALPVWVMILEYGVIGIAALLIARRGAIPTGAADHLTRS